MDKVESRLVTGQFLKSGSGWASEILRGCLEKISTSYPLLGPKYLLLGTLYPQLRVQGGSWN